MGLNGPEFEEYKNKKERKHGIQEQGTLQPGAEKVVAHGKILPSVAEKPKRFTDGGTVNDNGNSRCICITSFTRFFKARPL